MTYLEFHLFFILPPILLMSLTLPRSLDKLGGWRARWAIPLIAFIAFSYTTPWDNYLVANEVWWYGPERVIATIAYVPVEEYLFFVLQPVLTGLFYFQYTSRWDPSPQRAQSLSAWLGYFFFLVVAVIGGTLLVSGWWNGFYLGLILSWAAPILAGMWLYDGQTLWAHRSTLFVTVAVPTVYLWVADATAIRTGIWSISTQYTVGLSPLGLPVEEATFFLMTNLLVIHGLLLLLYGSHETVAVPSS